jgi:UMF1 family MFS transporter
VSELNSEADLVAVRPEADEAAGKLPVGAAAWAIFEGARNPYVILVTIYIFAPYVAATFIGQGRPDASVVGQEILSRWNTYSSIVIMLTAPFLGASIDKLGQRKTWLAAVVALMVASSFALWWARPDYSGLSIVGVLLIFAVMNVLFPWSEVLHNSLLVRAAGLGKAHKASGLALALGNGFSVVALAFTAWAFALPGKVPWSWVPHAPLFGLNAATHEPERIVAPMAAVIFALGALPLFFLTPDAPSTGMPVIKAFREGARTLWSMVTTVKNYRDAATFLLARMFYVDGMTAILLYAGVYLGGVMKWGPLDLLIYGILLSIFAVFGGFVGRWLDASLGPKRAVQIAILMSLLGILAFMGNAPDKILYLWRFDPAAHAPLWNGPVFRTLPDVIMLCIGFSNATFITAHYASSRTLLTRLTPPSQTATFFGVYALSGTATLWLGNLMVNLGTRIFKTQQGGFASIAVLLAIGFVGLLFVRGGNRAAQG